MRRVFEQAYTRFLDLQKAEAQAREAQIEAALERVRSRSMSMQKSEELRKRYTTDFRPIMRTSFYHRIGEFCQCRVQTKVMILEFGLLHQVSNMQHVLMFLILDHPIFNQIVEAREKGECFYTQLLTKEEKKRFFDHFFKYAPTTEERKKNALQQCWLGAVICINENSGAYYL